MSDYSIQEGFGEQHRDVVGRLFWEAFSGKLGKAMAPADKATRFFSMVADPTYAYSAVSKDGRLLAVAGYKVREGAFMGGGFTELADVYGFIGAIPKLACLWILERDVKPGVLLMDGIFVDAGFRGMGLGSALLDTIVAEARQRNLRGVRLDVIDTNPDARRLYERRGFESTGTTTLRVLRPLFGFSSSTTMVTRVDNNE